MESKEAITLLIAVAPGLIAIGAMYERSRAQNKVNEETKKSLERQGTRIGKLEAWREGTAMVERAVGRKLTNPAGIVRAPVDDPNENESEEE